MSAAAQAPGAPTFSRARSARRPADWSAPVGAWGPDILGEGFEARTLELPVADAGDDEPPAEPAEATLVRYRPTVSPAAAGLDTEGGGRPAPRFVLLHVHGWNDYFFHWETAEHVHGLGGVMYALDLRGYGRSLRDDQLPGYVDDLELYTAEIDEAWRIITEEEGPGDVVPRFLAGHSTGGLVVSLWAADHPGTLAGLALNSPWLESLPLPGFTRLTAQALSLLTRGRPQRRLRIPDDASYVRSLAGLEQGTDAAWGSEPLAGSAATDGAEPDGEPTDGGPTQSVPPDDDPFVLGWDLEPEWRLESAPVFAGWVAAVLRAQARVGLGLEIDCPILVLSAARSALGIGAALREAVGDVLHPSRRPGSTEADIVLDVSAMRRRALDLGPLVSLASIDGAIHDVMASARPARRRAQTILARWIDAVLG